MMSEAAQWGRSHGAVELVLTTWVGNGDAAAFYERLGYRELSRVLTARCRHGTLSPDPAMATAG